MKNKINHVQFDNFGIRGIGGFEEEVLKHIKVFNNRSELENELNKLVNYIYDGKRTVHFNDFREFPYIQHGAMNSYDGAGLAKNYTRSDIYLIKFIREFMFYKDGKYIFFDVDFIIENTIRIEMDDCPITEMPIDVILK